MADTQDEVATRSVEVDKPIIVSCEREHKFVFNKCCFCCVPLRTGCLILAYLLLVGAILSGIYYILGITTVILFMSQFPEFSHENIIVTALVLNSVNVALTLFAIAFSVLLVIGLHKENRSFVRLFVRFQLAYIILYALLYTVVVIMAIMGYAAILDFFLGLVSLVFNIYCIVMMRSQYVKMGETVSSEPVGRYKDEHVIITP